MSKADGQYLGISFTEPLIGDVSGLTPNPVGGYAYKALDLAGSSVTTLNQYSSSYSGANAIDGSTSTYWRGTTAVNWLQIQLPEAKTATKLRIYMGSYYVSSLTLSGSADGEAWTQIGDTLTGASSTTAQWYEWALANTAAYLYYRVDTLTAYNSSRIYLYELELYESVGVGNEVAFTVTGQEYDFVPGGTLEAKTYTVAGVEAHPSEPNAILLTLDSLTRFCSVAGDITVAYDPGTGNLAGEGGAVDFFTVSFSPADLIPKPHQNDQEHIQIALSAQGDLIRIYYSDYQAGGEHVAVTGITAAGTLTNVEDI